MGIQSYQKQPNQIPEKVPGASHENFDFDLWSRAVRRQMMETLNKRQNAS